VYGRVRRRTASHATVASVKSWSLTEIEAPGGTVDPVVLTTDDGARAIAIRLEAGQALRDHQLRERAWVVVVEGEAELRSGDTVVDARAGTLVTFDPGERHAISSADGARVLMILAPWPGPGHYPDGGADA
jgi:quercetin dioxygenase-like cupin family protein